MKLLKHFAFFTTFSILALKVNAQSASTLQKAFQNSYREEAKKDYTKAIAYIQPFYKVNSYEINLRMGWLYYLARNYASSQKYYQNAVNIRPNSIEAKFAIIKPLAFLKNMDKVLEQYQSILKIDFQNKQANYWAGKITYDKQEYEASAKYFIKVVDAYPFDFDGNHMLGWALLLSGKKVEAKGYFERALLIKPLDSSCITGINKASK